MAYIDLGLSVKWADCNLGANTPEEVGEYYCYDDVKDLSDIPTVEQWKELQENCKFKYDKSKNGFIVTGPNSNSIFLPCAGERDGKIAAKTIGAFFWSSVYDNDFAWTGWLAKKTYAKKITYGVSFKWRNEFHISVRTIEK